MLAHADTNYWITWFPGAALAALGVLALIWKGISWLVTSTKTLKQVQTVLPKIEAEFSRNGGGSMKDRVEALHAKVDSQGSIMADHMSNDRQAFRRQDRFNGKIEASLERIEDKLSP